MNRSGQKFMLLPLFFITIIAVFLSVSGVVVVAAVAEDDVRCLRGLKSAFRDPQGKLGSWTFSDTSAVGFICKFTGASCWNERENRLISLQLPSMDLAADKIPDSLRYCGSIQTLDLSGNEISGTIPSQICDWMPYVVNLDLSRNYLSGPIPPELEKCKFLNNLILGNNYLSGPIPPELEKCKFLNNLMLGNNRLSGPIPDELGSLKRLKKFYVANNNLTGQIPSFMSSFDPADFKDNPVLCGRPLYKTCRGEQEYLGMGRDGVILGSVVYFVVTVLSCWCWYWLLFAEIKTKIAPHNQTPRQSTPRE